MSIAPRESGGLIWKGVIVAEEPSPLLAKYLITLDPPDLAAARRLANRCLHQDMGPAAFVEQVLVPAQEEVGRRWQANEYTVPQEHAATAVTDGVLATLSSQAPLAPGIPGRIVSCCVEGEWHTLPLRMVSDTLVMEGRDVVYLGPSVPSPQLTGFLRDIDPVALVASCTAANRFAGARRTIEAAHDAGVPVIIGGRALGTSSARADSLGADAWASSASTVGEVLARWTDRRPELAHAYEVGPEQAPLENPRPALVEDCLDLLLERRPRLREMTATQVDRTREDLAYIMQFCGAALVTHDPTVLHEFTIWLRDLLAARGVPASSVKAGYDAIADVLGPDFPVTRKMLTASAALI